MIFRREIGLAPKRASGSSQEVVFFISRTPTHEGPNLKTKTKIFIQVSTVRNVDYYRNCCSHPAWGCFFFYKCRPYEISIIIGIVAPMLHGDTFFLQVSTVRNFDYHRNCCSHAAWGYVFSTSVDRTKFRLSSELLLP